MKITRSSILAIAVAAAFAMPAVSHAADGTITINGKVTAGTCTINANGSGSASPTVTLPTVTTSQLATAGTTAGRTAFNIALTGCTPNSGNVATWFQTNGGSIDTTTGNLANTSGTATNVEVGLLNSDASVIALNGAEGAQNSEIVALTGTTTGSATLNYFAQYVANGAAAGAGTVSTTVLYSIVYQ